MTNAAFTENCQNPLRVLVAEFLLANSNARQDAAPSMLGEAAAMLKGVVEDIAALSNVHVTVLLNEAFDLFGASGCRNRIHLHRGELQSDTLQTILRGNDRQTLFDAVLIIAPECDGVLVSLLKAAQESAVSQVSTLNLNWRLAEVFADKHLTDKWLRQQHIPTIPTCTVDDTTAYVLRETDGNESRVAFGERCVLKPRDGAGADRVQIVRLRDRRFQDLPQRCSDTDRWILQPLMPGLACSIGFIGGGESGSTTILPPARQDIQLIDGTVSYDGGQIPCGAAIASRIAPVSRQIACALGVFNGYVGADLLVDLSALEDSEDSVRVVEINPRLCTSYVGYRSLAMDNLAAFILQQQSGTAIRWKSGAVRFTAAGTGIDVQPDDG